MARVMSGTELRKNTAKFVRAKDRPGELKKLRAELAAIRVMDPACMCNSGVSRDMVLTAWPVLTGNVSQS